MRREYLDYVIFLNVAHLRRVLKAYAIHYDHAQSHWSLDKDAPTPLPVIARSTIRVLPNLGGLHRAEVRI